MIGEKQSQENGNRWGLAKTELYPKAHVKPPSLSAALQHFWQKIGSAAQSYNSLCFISHLLKSREKVMMHNRLLPLELFQATISQIPTLGNNRLQYCWFLGTSKVHGDLLTSGSSAAQFCLPLPAAVPCHPMLPAVLRALSSSCSAAAALLETLMSTEKQS